MEWCAYLPIKTAPFTGELHISYRITQSHMHLRFLRNMQCVYLCLHLKMNFLHSVGKTSLCFPLSWPLYPVSVYRLLCIPVSVEVLLLPGQKLFPVLRKSDQFLSLYLHPFLILPHSIQEFFLHCHPVEY